MPKFPSNPDNFEHVNPVKALMIVPQFNLRNKEFVRQLKADRNLPHYLLMDPEFFEEAVNFGHRSLCPILLRQGQKVNILKANGDNYL